MEDFGKNFHRIFLNRAMKKILLIVLGELSSGELVIAYEFAKNIVQSKYQIDFLIPEKRFNLIKSYNKGKVNIVSPHDHWKLNREKIEVLLKKEEYDLLILFDIFTFEYAQKWTGIDLDILKSFSIPIASLDEYNYLSGDFKLDYYGLIVKKLPNLFEKIDFIIRNCPLSLPNRENGEEGIYFYKVLSKKKIDLEKRRKIRQEILEEEEKLVFFTLSDWELNGAYSFINHKFLMDYLLPIVYEYLVETGEKIHFIHVGASKWTGYMKERENIRYSHYPSLPVEKFEDYLLASDLYITYNLVSITLTKAIEFEVPSIVLNNDKIIDFTKLEKKLKTKPQWYQEMAEKVRIVYPFSASTFGWNHFLKPIAKDNLYMNTFYRLQSFHTASVISTIKNLLEKGQSQEAQGKPVIIFSHHPVYDTVRKTRLDKHYIEPKDKMRAILDSHPGQGVFVAGHTHAESIASDDKWTYVNLDAFLDHPKYSIMKIGDQGIRLTSKEIDLSEDMDAKRLVVGTHMPHFLLRPEDIGTSLDREKFIKF